MSRRPERRKPSIEAFRALLAFHETESVVAAARALRQSQSVLSRKLDVFLTADACGAALLKRSDGVLKLTQDGLAVLPAVRELVQRYDQLLAFIQRRRSTPEVVRVAVGGFAAQHYVPRTLSLIRNLADTCDVETLVTRGGDRIEGVVDRRYEFAVVSHSPLQIQDIAAEHAGHDAQLVVELLASLPMCVIARRESRDGQDLADMPGDQEIPLEKLRGRSLVGLDHRSGIRRQLEQHFAEPDALNFLAEGGGWSAAKEFVRYGLGIAIVPIATLAPEDRANFVVRRMSRDLRIGHYLVHRPEPLTPGQQTVRNALLQAAEAHHAAAELAWNHAE